MLERLRGSDAHGSILLQHLGEEIVRRGGCASPTELDELEPIGDELWVTHLRWGGGGGEEAVGRRRGMARDHVRVG